MVAMIDLEKAYDRIDWNFLELVLMQVGFQRPMVKLIMLCITSSSLSIISNDKKLDGLPRREH